MMEAVLVVATLAAPFAPRLAEGYTPRPEFLVLSAPPRARRCSCAGASECETCEATARKARRR